MSLLAAARREASAAGREDELTEPVPDPFARFQFGFGVPMRVDEADSGLAAMPSGGRLRI